MRGGPSRSSIFWTKQCPLGRSGESPSGMGGDLAPQSESQTEYIPKNDSSRQQAGPNSTRKDVLLLLPRRNGGLISKVWQINLENLDMF